MCFITVYPSEFLKSVSLPKSMEQPNAYIASYSCMASYPRFSLAGYIEHTSSALKKKETLLARSLKHCWKLFSKHQCQKVTF